MQYFPLFHDLRNRNVAVVGGGAAAVRKLELLRRAGARPTVFASRPDAAVLALADSGGIELRRRPPRPADIEGAALAVVADVSDAVARQVARMARAAGVPVNVVDRADLSTAIMPAIVDRDPVLVAVSSAGTPPTLGRLAHFAGRFRGAVAAARPAPADRRRFWERMLDGPIAQAVLAGREAEAGEAMLRAINLRPASDAAAGGVALVGIGPGDPDLLTLRALGLIEDADLVLHDAATPPALLDRARRDARRIDVGARGQRPAAVERLMRREVMRSRRVVLLVPGDAASDPASNRMARRLRAAGIAVEIVLGIAAVTAAPPASLAG
jgi:uroporphyrin-III C-methyltransferase/precorrin-2 dehydrogenase/sirohydrochlorin ferrochelatase